MELRLDGARVLWPDGFGPGAVGVSGGVIVEGGAGRPVDLSGFDLLPGIVDIHGDGFERHLAPRRGALRDADHGIVALEAELAGNGITTAVLAQFYSWEGGMRGPEAAARLAGAVAEARARLLCDLRLQLRLETHIIDAYPEAEALIDRAGIGYVVFNDHLPHAALSAGKRPPRLTGQALKAGCNPDKYLARMQALHDMGPQVPGALTALAARLAAKGIRMGSHDDATVETREWYRGIGAGISEFPETRDAAEAARQGGDFIVMGAPNVVRGASHAGKISAREVIEAGLCDALASDYHYPAPLRAVLDMDMLGILPLERGWRFLSAGPAQGLGLTDRGRIAPGLRADLVILDPATGQVGATIAGGRIAYLRGDCAARFMG